MSSLDRKETFGLYRAASMQGGISDERNVCPSVKRMNCDKTKETSAEFLHRIKGPFI